jgi:hypothetical protein
MAAEALTSGLDGWPVGCLRLTADDRVSLWNRQLVAWTGLAEAEVLGRSIGDVVPTWELAGLAAGVTTVRVGSAPVIVGPGTLGGAFAGAFRSGCHAGDPIRR